MLARTRAHPFKSRSRAPPRSCVALKGAECTSISSWANGGFGKPDGFRRVVPTHAPPPHPPSPNTNAVQVSGGGLLPSAPHSLSPIIAQLTLLPGRPPFPAKGLTISYVRTFPCPKCIRRRSQTAWWPFHCVSLLKCGLQL